MDKKSAEEESDKLKVLSEENPVRLEVDPADQQKLSKTGKPISIYSDSELEEVLGNLDVEGEQGWGANSKRSIAIGWWVLGGLALIGLGAWVVSSVYKAQDDLGEEIEIKEELLRDSAEELAEIRNTQERMEFAVQEYFGANSIDRKLVHVRHPKRVRKLMEKYYQTEELQSEEFKQFSQLQTVALGSRPFILALVKTDKGSRKIIIEELDSGEFLIDWETNVNYQPMPWSEFIKQRVSDPIRLRVMVKRDNFYAYEFRNEQEYQCYRIADVSKKQFIYGYVKRGSREMLQIEEVLRTNTSDSVALILKMHFPKDSLSKRAVLIDKVIARRWLYISPPVDE